MTRGERAQRFEPEPPSTWALLTLWLSLGALPLLFAGIALFDAITRRASPAIFGGDVASTLLVVGALAVLMLGIAAGMHALIRRSSVEFDGDTLRIRAAWYRQAITLARLDLAQARILSLGEFPQYRPLLKTNAISLPGYGAGHYRLRDLRRKAFCLRSGPDRILLLPERSGRVILLSLRQPRALLDALTRAAAAAPR